MSNNSFLDKVKKFWKDHPVIIGVSGMIIVIVVVIWITMWFLSVWTHHGEEVIVPDIRNCTYREAVGKLNAVGLELEISDSIYDTTLPPGTIIESWPKADSKVKPYNRKVYVTITSFSPRMITISAPLVGVSERQAESYLNSYGINGIRIINVPSEYNGLVENAYYNGRELRVGSQIPVDANVTLEVGFQVAPVDEPVEDDYVRADDYETLHEEPSARSSEEAVYDDFVNGESGYIEYEP